MMATNSIVMYVGSRLTVKTPVTVSTATTIVNYGEESGTIPV